MTMERFGNDEATAAQREEDARRRRRRRTDLYQYMTPESFREGEEVQLNDIVLAFKQHTTSTGLPHINFSRGPIKKGWWLIVTLASLSVLLYNLYTLGLTYLAYNVNVAIDVAYESQLTFPSITLCNMNPVRQSAFYNLTSGFGNSTSGSPSSSNPAAAGGSRRRRKRRSAGGVTGTMTTSASISQSTMAAAAASSTAAAPSDKCCCSCCFSSLVVGQNNNYCACNATDYPYDVNSCPLSSSSSYSNNSWINPTTTTATTTSTTTTQTTTTNSSLSSSQPTTTDAPVTTVYTTSQMSTTTTTNPATTTYPATTEPDTAADYGSDEDADEEEEEEEELIETLAALQKDVKVEMGYSIDDMILDCTFEGYECDMSNFASFFNEIHGNCYVFNSGWINYSAPQMSTKTGRRHGLTLILNVYQDEYLSIGDDTAGIRLVVSDPLRMPFPEDEGLALNPGQSTSIGLRQNIFTRLTPPYDTCVDPSIKNIQQNVYEELYPGIQYSSVACMRTCYQSNMISGCGCGDPAYPLVGTVFGATINNPFPPCLQKNLTQQSCRNRIISLYNNNTLNCNCPDACSDTDYLTTLSIGLWPSDVQKKTILSSLEGKVSFSLNDSTSTAYEENLVKVEVFFEEFQFELLQEVPAYLRSKFISDCGGVLGLWLGMSVLTACEFLEFGVDLMVFGIDRWRKKKRLTTSSPTQINVQPATDQCVQPSSTDPDQPATDHGNPENREESRPATASSTFHGYTDHENMSSVA